MELIIALYTTPIGIHPELIGWWMLGFLRLALAVGLVGAIFTGVRGFVRTCFA